jgi:hypothetical protein
MNSTYGSLDMVIFYTAPNQSIILPMSAVYDLFGETFLATLLYSILVIPISVISIILSIIGFLVLNREEFSDQPLFAYYRVTMLASVAKSIMSLFGNLFYCQRFASALGSYGWTFVTVYLDSFFINLLIFFGTLIDSIIILERIVLFEPKAKFLLKYSPLVNSLALFVFAGLISVPQLFSYEIVDYRRLTHIYGFALSVFANSSLGTIVTYVMLFIRIFLNLPVQIVLNIISVILFKRFIAKKTNILGSSKRTDTQAAGIAVAMTTVAVTYQQLQQAESTLLSNTNGAVANVASKKSDMPANETSFSLSAVQKLFYMVLALELVAILSGCVLAAVNIYSLLVGISILFIVGVNLTIAIEPTISFLIFFAFNKKFKSAIIKSVTNLKKKIVKVAKC